MYCPDCGHNNPEANRFCGMCGEPLPERKAKSPDATHFSTERANTNPESPASQRAAQKYLERRERIADHDPEPVAASFRHRERLDEAVRELPGTGLSPARQNTPQSASVTRPEPAAITYAAAPHLESATPVEQPATTLSGPSFLGLSSGPNGSETYSYLYEDEAPKSHAGFLAFLLFLAVVGGVVYWEWQPIQNWVINRANQKVDTGAPAPTAGSPTASSDNANTPPAPAQPTNATPIGTDSSATPASQAPNQSTAQPSAAPDKSSTPKATDNTPKSNDNTTPEDQDESKAADPVKPERAASTRKPAAKAKKPVEARDAAPEAPPGTDLVASGEKYLYGRGVPQNCGHAVEAFNNAAKLDNPRGMAHLGALFATGECVPLNRVRAYEWFSRALSKDRNNTYLEHNLSMLWREMDANEKAQVSGQAETARSKRF